MIKELAEGAKAVGLFNPGKDALTVTVDWAGLGIQGHYQMRDLWRQQDLGEIQSALTRTIPEHGVFMVRLSR